MARSAHVTATILDGKATLATIKDELRVRIKALADRGVVPGLGTVLVGDDPGSRAYVAGKHRDCAELGIASIRRDLPGTATQSQVFDAVAELNADPTCAGYIVQLPLPKGLDELAVLEAVDPAKDADGLHPVNLGRLVLGRPLRCRAPRAASSNCSGDMTCRSPGPRSSSSGAGRPSAGRSDCSLTRRSENATVTLCHTGTRDLAAHVRSADIVVAAAGVPGLITAEMVKPGAAVLDVGISRVELADGKTKLVGDVAPDVREIAGHLAPMPGGVGLMTRGMLLTNVVELAEVRAAR